VDIAVDPLEGTNLCATGASGAMAVLAAAEQGGLLHAPDIYMEKLVVPGIARDRGFLEVALQRFAGSLELLLLETQLDRGVSVGLRRLDLDHEAGARFHDRDGNDLAVVGENLSHAFLATQNELQIQGNFLSITEPFRGFMPGSTPCSSRIRSMLSLECPPRPASSAG